MKKLFLFTGLFLLTACNSPVENEKPLVVTSFYPLAYFTEQIAGDAAEVQMIVPELVEPHDYSLEASDLSKLENADLIIVQGGGVEPWSEELWNGSILDNEAPVLSFEYSLSFETNEDGEVDPHTWLDPVQAQEMVVLIKDRLIVLDPENATLYEQNAATLTARLESLDSDYQSGLTNCERRSLIVTHDAFGYLASRYNLETLPILNVSREDEPSLEELAELADYAKENGLTHIFMESLENPEVVQVLADEGGLEVLTLNPIEGRTAEEQLNGDDYFTFMQSNLSNLKTALACQ